MPNDLFIEETDSYNLNHDFTKLENQIENYLIKNYVFEKTDKKTGKKYFSIQLNKILSLSLNDYEIIYIFNYLGKKGIRICGTDSMYDGLFDNYDYCSISEGIIKIPYDTDNFDMFKRYQETKDSKLRDKIIVSNLGLVSYIAFKYSLISGVEQKELESYGYEGLILAVDRFDLNYNTKFSTYAYDMIRGYIAKGIQREIFGNIYYNYYKYLEIITSVEKKHQIRIIDCPSLIEEVLEKLVENNLINNTFFDKYRARMRINSIIGNRVSINDENMYEYLLLKGYLTNEFDFDTINLKVDIYSLLAKENKSGLYLTESEKWILIYKFGLNDEPPKTFSEIAKLLQKSYTRIQRLYKRALKKLQIDVYRKKLVDYYDMNAKQKKL